MHNSNWAKYCFSVLKWVILVSAYAFLIYKLATFEHYSDLLTHFQHIEPLQIGFLLAVLALMPLNIFCESKKWQQLIAGLQPMSIKTAIKSVLVGQVGAFFTPNRLGDYPTRALLLDKHNAAAAIALGGVGSVMLTGVITIFGLIGGAFYVLIGQPDFVYNASSTAIAFFVAIIIIFFVAIIVVACLYKQITQRLNSCSWQWLRTLGEGLQHLTLRKFCQLLLITAARYCVFSLQFYAALLFFGVNLSPIEALVAIPSMYLLVTYTPSFAASEVVVRGSYAILVLSAFSANEAGMAFASILVWCINYCVPMAVGSFLFPKETK